MNANLFFGGILFLLLRPLYRAFETMFSRELTLIDDETLVLKTGWYPFKINRQRCFITLNDAPLMVYGPSSLDMGVNICIVRNDRSFVNRIFKNRITLVHRDTLEEAEIVMKELKELFSINDFWDIQRIKYEKRQNKNARENTN
ncbi:MAG: hypothetical protein JNM21_11520 [Taibaiella sp.]|nr:hypothetical protein [Taibaiella sp.]